jgi:hypothetical protein
MHKNTASTRPGKRDPIRCAHDQLTTIQQAILRQGIRPTATKMGVHPMVASRIATGSNWPRLDDLALACRATGTRILLM